MVISKELNEMLDPFQYIYSTDRINPRGLCRRRLQWERYLIIIERRFSADADDLQRHYHITPTLRSGARNLERFQQR
jgi:hypothetical protein